MQENSTENRTEAPVIPGARTSNVVRMLFAGAFLLFLLALGAFWFLRTMTPPPFSPSSVLAEDAIIDGTQANEKVVTPEPLSDAALASVTVQPPSSAVAAPLPPTTLQAFLAFFSNDTVSTRSEGVIQWMNAEEGLFSIKDKETDTLYTVFAPAGTKIMRGKEPITFAALNIADVVMVEGERERSAKLILASSVFVTSALSMPPAL